MDKSLADKASAEIGISVEQVLREWWELVLPEAGIRISALL